MKTRKFTKVISFILSLVFVFSTIVIKASAYSTVTTTYDCPKSLCFSDLVISGPYGDPNETVDNNVPFLNGKTYANVFNSHYWSNSDKYNDYHMYIIYCPKYDNSDSSVLRHTMTLMFAHHGYTTKSYSQYNGSYHYANKKCDHGTDFRGSNVYALSQSLCGENAYLSEETMLNLAEDYQAQNGCGKEASILEPHTWTYGSWYDAGNGSHARTKTCSVCGYSTIATQTHTLSASEWTNSSDAEHKRTISCSICKYSRTDYEIHGFTYGSWEKSSDTQHKITATCSTCCYSKTEYESHNLTTSDGVYYGSEEPNYNTYPGNEYHRYDTTCSICDYTNSKYELHKMYVKTPWYDASDTRHKQITQCYHCRFSVATNSPHNYPENLYTYESVDDTSHQITKHCDTCDRAIGGGSAKHSFVYGEWTDNSDGTCTREKTCSLCGYKGTESAGHSFTYEKWVCDTNDKLCNNAHRRTKTCSNCGYSEKEYEDHSKMFVWDQASWQPFSEKMHERSQSCPVCKQVKYSYSVHHYRIADDKYSILSAEEHERTETCYECGEPKITVEAHKFTVSTIYTQFSETQHQVTQSCICGEKHISYADHIDQNSDCYCDKCGYLMTKFSVTVPTTMVLTMGTDGEVYAPSDVVIINNSTAAVSVKKADINSRNGWNIVPYSTNMANEKVDSKKIGFKMNGIQTDSAGTTDSLSYNNSWIIEKDTSSSVVYDAVVSATSSPIDEQVIEIVYIVDWKE